ncbi:SRPBCC family protein [Propylenella binzhouense]|nr:carbon monoxide dehydrogenase subunit G [Propylenella binzhouense]
MKVELKGNETIAAPRDAVWTALNDPAFLAECIPGCSGMREVGPDAYKVDMNLKVASVGGTFEGDIALSDKEPPRACRITVSGAGTLGHGNGEARFEIEDNGDGTSALSYQGKGEVGGLVAGVGQRILGSVAKHLTGRFFKAAKQKLEAPEKAAAGA